MNKNTLAALIWALLFAGIIAGFCSSQDADAQTVPNYPIVTVQDGEAVRFVCPYLNGNNGYKAENEALLGTETSFTTIYCWPASVIVEAPYVLPSGTTVRDYQIPDSDPTGEYPGWPGKLVIVECEVECYALDNDDTNECNHELYCVVITTRINRTHLPVVGTAKTD